MNADISNKSLFCRLTLLLVYISAFFCSTIALSKLKFSPGYSEWYRDYLSHVSASAVPLNLVSFSLICLAVGWSVFLEKNLKLDRSARWAFRLFTIISLFYLYNTAPAQRTFDVFEGGGHADYIKHVALEGTLPKMGTGWEYHQPPLYYILSAQIFNIIKPATDKIPWQVFQVMNWVIFQLFIATGLRIIQENIKSKSALTFAIYLFALWPLNMLHAARIGNDNLTYLFAALSMLYFFRNYREPKRGDLLLSLAYLGLGSLVKNTVLPLGACYGLYFCYSIIKKSAGLSLTEILSNKPIHRELTAISLLVAIAFISVLPKIIHYFNHQLDGTEALLFPGVSSHGGLSIKVSVANFIPFYSLTGLSEPFISPWDDRTGRNNFWTYMFKSALTAELSSGLYSSKLLAYLYMSGAYILLFIAILGLRNKTILLSGLLTLLLLVCAAGPILATLAKHNACNQDFRYIYYLTIPLSIATGFGIKPFQSSIMRALFYILVNITLISGNLFILKMACLGA